MVITSVFICNMNDLTGYIPKEVVVETLKNPSIQGKNLLEPLKSLAIKNNLPVKILEDKEVVNDAEIHIQEGDLWNLIDGKVTFIIGGELVNAWKALKNGLEDENELRSKEIRNGEEVNLKPGDWLWVPPGQPHQHKTKTSARLFIIKIPR